MFEINILYCHLEITSSFNIMGNTSKIWKYFEVLSDNPGQPRCTTCDSVLKCKGKEEQLVQLLDICNDIPNNMKNNSTLFSFFTSFFYYSYNFINEYYSVSGIQKLFVDKYYLVFGNFS